MIPKHTETLKTVCITGSVERQLHTFGDILAKCVANGTTKKDLLLIYYETPGGDYELGLSIIEILKQIQKICTVAVVNISAVQSMGMPIFMAIKYRYFMGKSYFMAHKAVAVLMNDDLSVEDAAKHNKSLKKCNKTLFNLSLKKLKLTKAQLETFEKGKDLFIRGNDIEKSGIAAPYSEIHNFLIGDLK